MSDPWDNYGSNADSGMQPFVSNPTIPNMPWDFGYPSPDRNSIDEILNKGLGPLSPEAINGSPLLYTNPDAYFAPLRASNPSLSEDTVSSGGGGDALVGDAGKSPFDFTTLWNRAKPIAARGAGIAEGTAAAIAEALAIAGGILLWPSSTEDQSEDTDQYVVRGGISEPDTLQTSVRELTPLGYPDKYGISSATAPNMTVDQIAAISRFKNPQISYTTNWALGAKGYPVLPTPTNNPLHASIITPPSLTDEQAAAMSALFALNRRPNPMYGK